jgi:hypothetical protein
MRSSNILILWQWKKWLIKAIRSNTTMNLADPKLRAERKINMNLRYLQPLSVIEI